MTNFTNKLGKKIYNSKNYRDASKNLFEAYISKTVGSAYSIEKSTLRKLLSAAQIFYRCKNNEIKNEGSIVLSMILDVFADEQQSIVPIANMTYSVAGDFPNTSLLRKRYPEIKYTYDLYSEALVRFKKNLNNVEELQTTLTDFQRKLWENLKSDVDVITSAPTSAGKTFIILNYLVGRIKDSDGAFAAIIVPTRALISEVAGKIYELSIQQGSESEIEICTIPKDGDFKDKTIFVMTQERLHEILLRGDLSFDYLFIDEAHNITDDSRGVLLHLTIEKLLEDSLPQIIVSMPSPKYQDSFSSIFENVKFEKELTEDSPVAKILISVSPKGRYLTIKRNGSDNIKTIPKNFGGRRLQDIVVRLGSGQSNIIYRNKTNHCEEIANKIAEIIKVENPDALLIEAADYIEKFVHKDFSLASNLKKGVAFHYGPLPSSIRTMIENLAKDGHINYIACTSTLAEGINLPAKNLFLKNPTHPIMHQPPDRIEDVKISNITGRAGRMLEHFSGNIYLIEPENWTFQDYFEESNETDIKIPTYFKTLNESFDSVLEALAGHHSHTETDQYKLYAIANKLLKEYSDSNLNRTLTANELELEDDYIDLLKMRVKSTHESLKVSAFTLQANPSVGFIQQNKLFTFLDEQENLSNWILPHPKSADLYTKLLEICTKLQEFGVYMPTENYTLEYICVITKKWIQENSLKSIIAEQIDWEKNSGKSVSVNTSVRNVIKVLNNDIGFRLSTSLKCYNHLLGVILAQKNLDFSSTKLHSYIEIGACSDRLVNLINIGLSREAAIEIDQHLPKNMEKPTTEQLRVLLSQNQLTEIHAITRKELFKLIS